MREMLTRKQILLGLLAILLRTMAEQQQQQSQRCQCGIFHSNVQSVVQCAGQLCRADTNRSVTCAFFDSGSRVCDTEPSEAASQKDQILVSARLTRNGVGNAIEIGRRMIQLQLTKLKIPDLSISKYYGELSVSQLTISRLIIPKLNYQLVPFSAIRVFATGGEFEFCVYYRAELVWNLGEGQLCVKSDPGKGIDLDMAVTTTMESNGNLQLKLGVCSLKMPAEVEVKDSYGLVTYIIENLMEELMEHVAPSYVCEVVGETLDTLVRQMLAKVAEKVTVTDMFDVSHVFRAAIVEEIGVQVVLGANITFPDEP